jgi:hypothetical protein
VTWFANEILAPAAPSLVREMLAFAGYRDAVHVVTSLDSYPFHQDNVRHGLPREGLLVVRPVGDPSDLGEWYDTPVIPWLPPPDWPQLGLSYTTSAIAALVPEAADSLPPDAFLSSLKGLSARHGVPIAYGYFSTWGGTNELEYAWVFSDVETVMVNASEDNRHAMLRDNAPLTEVAAGLLGNLCGQLGFALPTGFFAPHTSRFPWAKHLVGWTPR